ncbi:MAG: bifunctional hydroxymethylpyrimidine kinase/phosphomethylpyrimidine kinase [Saezia sp.]
MSDVTFSYARVLTIATSDSGGGAGIQADLKTIAALGCYGMSVIVALTAQNTVEVRAIHEAPVSVINAQLDAVIDDIGTDAVKIGMLFSREIILCVAQGIRSKQLPHVVLDPVMVSATGAKLIKDDAIQTMIGELFPLAEVITPNIDEAALLLGQPISSRHDLGAAARALLDLGARAVLLKGAHLQNDDVVDILAMRHQSTHAVELYELGSPRIHSHNLHGAGCTLSAAIASYLALGLDLPSAVQAARVYVMKAIEAGLNVKTGRGVGPLNHTHAPQAMKLKS